MGRSTCLRPRSVHSLGRPGRFNPTKLIEVVEIGKQLLMTRGALTRFSIANDVAKDFSTIPAMFLDL